MQSDTKQNQLIKNKGESIMYRGFFSTQALAIAAAFTLAPAAAQAEGNATDGARAPVQVAAADVMKKWKDLIRAAKREGKVEVNLGGQMPRKLRKAMPAFTEKYGIKVNFKTGGSRGHRARMFAERKMGRYSVDVWIGGANGALAAIYPKKIMVSLPELLIDPQVTNQKLWYKGKHHYTDPQKRYIFTWGASPSYTVAFNTKMVKEGEIKSYKDLLNPKWKGKIVSWMPYRTGTAATTVPMFLNPNLGEKWFRRWANEMDVTIVRDSRQGAEWVAMGRYAIGMFGMSTQAKSMEDQGFPIQAYLPYPMAEGEVLSASAANLYAIKNPPNPNARTLFINWALSKEAQSLFIKIGQTSDSLRMDVDHKLIAKQYRFRSDRKYYIPFEDPAYIANNKMVLKKLRKIMKEAGYKTSRKKRKKKKKKAKTN
jgi:ABC-type Fe3+ transport system substrate-binding protein